MTIERIIKLRRLLTIHSYIYYHMGTSLVSSDTWDVWAKELVDLQEKHGNKHGLYDRYFHDWDGTTGMHLPQDEYVRTKAEQLVNYHNKLENTK